MDNQNNQMPEENKNNNNNNENSKKFKIIFSPQLANFLLKHGYVIVKLKPKRNSIGESVFVFEVEEGFYDVMNEWTEITKEADDQDFDDDGNSDDLN